MRKHTLLFLSLLALVVLGLGGYGALTAQQPPSSTAVKSGRWSDAATWADKKVPAANAAVTIDRNVNVVLDASPTLRSLTINGKLSFADTKDIEVSTEWIMVHGDLEIGTEAKSYTHKATITLTDNVKGEDFGGLGGGDRSDRGIMLMGGTLSLHGDRTNTWTKLANTANAGATSIQVLNAAQWRVGDEIVLASTDFDPRQAERRTISAINGNNITLDKKLDYMHFGKITFDVDERGEVGLLTRNVKIQAANDAEQSFFGGHIMAMSGSKMMVEGVELNRMGQNLTLARYPIHWHLIGDAQGQYIKNASIHNTYNRCVTMHGTNFLRVENNVTYDNVGHCFFLEDGIEHGNEIVHNLAIMTKCHTSKPCQPTVLAASGEAYASGRNGQQSKDFLLPSDSTVASYWITNPDNTYRNNVAAGSDVNGFWMSLPLHPNGKFEGTEISANTWPRNSRVTYFKGNTAHSNYDAFMMDRHIATNNTFGVTGNMHIAFENPADTQSRIVETLFEDLTAYKNRNGGFWGRGEMRTYRNIKSADNAIGYTQASGLAGGASLADPYTSRVIDSLFVGETENIGNPVTDAEKAYGRSVPKRELPDFPTRGYEYYDARHDVINTKFVNFTDNATRKTGAFSYLLYTSFGVSSNNAFENVKFENAKPAYFPPMERKWANDNGNSQAYRTAVIRDKDGSLGAGPNAYILIHDGVNDSIATDTGACEIKATWNAAVCKGDVGRVNFGAVGAAAGPGRGGPGGPGAAKGGPGGPAALAAGPGAAKGGPGAAKGGPGAAKGGPGAAKGRGGAAAPAQPPVVLSRNGKDYTLPGASTNVRAGTEIKVTTERPSVALRLTEMDKGSWVIFELPGFNTAASGTQQASLAALRQASDTSYFKDNGALWVKLFSPDSGPLGLGGAAAIEVSR